VSPSYRVEFLPSAARELGTLPRAAQLQLAAAVDNLATEPRPEGATLLSGTGSERIWRLRVGAYRILYQVSDQVLVILIVRIADRREVYRSTAMKALLKRIKQSRT
jgi:mRNA interferase RelE/StbE